MASARHESGFRSLRVLLDEGAPGGLADDQLLGRFLDRGGAGAEAAFEALVERHGSMVLGVCREILGDLHDAQDAFQSTFLVLARRADTIRRRDSLASWLFGVARKVATRARSDAARRRARERASAVGAESPAPAREPGDFAALFEEIDRLPGIYREPVVLCYLQGLTYEAAAEHLRCPVGTVSVRLKRAKERLRGRLSRRDGVVPADLPAAARAPGSGRAAVPAWLAGRTARAATQFVSGRATVAGVVSAVVARRAERMISLMRYRSIGASLILGGGLTVLAATASLALFEPPGAPEVAARPEGAGPARPWLKELPDGVTVELLGVSAHPSAAGTWRDPHGMPLLAPPYAKMGAKVFPGEGQQSREFAVRLGHPPGAKVSHQWEFLPRWGSCADGSPLDVGGKPVPGLVSFAAGLPGELKVCTVRFGVAAGPWKTEISHGPDGSALGRQGISVIFGRAREVAGKTSVTITHDASPEDMRVAAVDLEGKEHAPGRQTGLGVRDYVQREAEFDLPLARVKEFRLQSRPYHWATFEGVVLGD